MISVYMRMHGLAIDPLYARIDVSEEETLPPEKYAELLEHVRSNKADFLKCTGMAALVKPENVEVITEEEYFAEADDDDCEEAAEDKAELAAE